MKWLVTGGLGFIGTNLVEYLIERGETVTVIDDKSRVGVELNEQYLWKKFKLKSEIFDIVNKDELNIFFRKNSDFDSIIHLAGQVSYMESLANPYRDFEINALGTLNILEHIRLNSQKTKFIGLSSNKVYGDLEYISYAELPTRYELTEFPNGLNENLKIDPKGSYSVSKSVLDLYVQDFARLYDLWAISFRQSSVYGPHQHPKADQGWVAYLAREFFANNQIQLNGKGKQVRDLLHVYDLCELIYKLVIQDVKIKQNYFNIGGGIKNSLSILELFNILENNSKIKSNLKFGNERPFDQKVFISDNTKILNQVQWKPNIDLHQGLELLIKEITKSEII